MPNTDIDIVWQNVGGYDFEWRWEGYIASYSFTLSGQESAFTTDLKGALYGLDDYLAIPSFPKRPIPYEILIAQAFDQNVHPAHLGKFRMLFPEDWDHDRCPVLERPDLPERAEALGRGHRTGLDRVHLAVHRLLGAAADRARAVHADGDVRRGRAPVEHPQPWSPAARAVPAPDPGVDRRRPIIEIDLGAPGVSLDGSRDFTQRAGVIYGAGHGRGRDHLLQHPGHPGREDHLLQAVRLLRAACGRASGNPNYDPRT